MYTGPGAGAEPTASSVVADIMDITRAIDAPEAAVKALGYAELPAKTDLSVQPIIDIDCSYYLRMNAEDHPGVMTSVTQVLSSHDINIDAITQQGSKQHPGYVDIVILTHTVNEATMNDAIHHLEQLSDIHSDILRIRVEPMA